MTLRRILRVLCILAFTHFAASAHARQEGVIAFARGGKEIWTVRPDGSGERRIWSHPAAVQALGVQGVAWRPDGKEIAFTSGHGASTSIFHSDVYAVKPDGTGLRRLTNAPDPAEYGRYKKGTVRLTVRNSQIFVRESAARSSTFIVYVAGADEPQRVTVPVGSAKTVVFPNVADFGATAQQAVAIHGRFRWFIPGGDVVAGNTESFPELVITGDGVELHGAFRPTWRADGSKISYRNGLCMISSVNASPVPGQHVYQPLFAAKHPLGTCTWDWGTDSRPEELLYTENSSGDPSIYRIKEGGRHPGEKLTAFTNIPYQTLLDLHWQPNGGGFLFSDKNLFRDSANIFRYDIASKVRTQVTKLEKEFARMFSVSPDGRWIVFERGREMDEDSPADLWIVGTDGSGLRLLVRNGLRPSWGRS
jgi:hypothetical protein